MKTNPERITIYPKFKDMLKIEAASKGKSVVQFTKEIAESKTPLISIKEEWDKKWKRTEKPKWLDFP